MNICNAPWTSISIWSNGAVSPCCHIPPLNIESNVVYGSILDACNGPFMRKIRSTFMLGEIPKECRGCHTLNVNEKYPSPFGIISEHIDISSIQYAELRLTKRCPHSCVMCGEHLSSAHGGCRECLVLADIPDLCKFVPKRVLLTGGEPLMATDHERFFAHFAKNSTHIIYNSSGSGLKKRHIEMWKKAIQNGVKVSIHLSLDGDEKLNNFIRGKQSWSVATSAFNVISSQVPTTIQCTASALNFPFLNEAIKSWSHWISGGTRVYIHALRWPSALAVEGLPYCAIPSEKTINCWMKTVNKYPKSLQNIAGCSGHGFIIALKYYEQKINELHPYRQTYGLK